MTGWAGFICFYHNHHYNIPWLFCCGSSDWWAVSAPPLSPTSLIPPDRLRSGMKNSLLPPAGVPAPASVFFFPGGLMCQEHSSSKCVTAVIHFCIKRPKKYSLLENEVTIRGVYRSTCSILDPAVDQTRSSCENWRTSTHITYVNILCQMSIKSDLRPLLQGAF